MQNMRKDYFFLGIFDKAKQKISHIDASFLIGDTNSNSGGAATLSRSLRSTANDRVEEPYSAHTFTFFQDLGESNKRKYLFIFCFTSIKHEVLCSLRYSS